MATNEAMEIARQYTSDYGYLPVELRVCAMATAIDELRVLDLEQALTKADKHGLFPVITQRIGDIKAAMKGKP